MYLVSVVFDLLVKNKIDIMNKVKLILALSTVVILSTSCRKKETVEVDNETQSVIDNAIAEQEFMGVVPAVHQVAIRTKGTGADPNKPLATACDSLKLVSGDTLYGQPGHVPPTYTVDYSSSGCTLIPDNKIREGHLSITFYGRIKNPGSRMVIKMIGCKAANNDPSKKITYACDSIVVSTMINDNANKIRQFNVKIYNGKCQAASWNTEYSTNRFIRHEYQSNENTIKVWGSSQGKNRQGRNFIVTVDESTPLVKRENCQFISFGILKLKPDGFKERIVDYASGTGQDVCDDKATFTVNGNTVSFNLK